MAGIAMTTNFKTRPLRDKKYRLFVASHPCCICGKPSVAHHEQEKGHGTMGGKCDDNRCINLCPEHHHQRHVNGRCFWEWYEMDAEKIISDLREKYAQESNK